MKFDGDDYVLGDTTIGCVGCKASEWCNKNKITM